jgi:hypothetical protein
MRQLLSVALGAVAVGVGTMVSYPSVGATVETCQTAAGRQAVADARARVAATDPASGEDWLEQLARRCRDVPHCQDGIRDDRDWRQAEALVRSMLTRDHTEAQMRLSAAETKLAADLAAGK